MSACGAKTRAGEPCKLPAGHGTDHVGRGRCKLHGGASPIRNPASADTTELARYRASRTPALAALIEEFEKDPDPLNLLREVALLRALLQNALDRMADVCETCQRPPDEVVIPDLVERVSRIVSRIEQARAQRAISVVELVNLVNRLALAVKHHVPDPEIHRAIAADWHDIGVSITTRPGGKA